MFQLVEDICKDDNLEELAKQVDVIFTATPQGFLAGLLTEEILSQVKIVDLSADYRIKDVATYEKWYGIEHKSPQFIEEAVYGLCEINRDKITEKTRLVANPGCYTTCSILTAYPMVKEGMIDVNTLIVDAKSGTSGAGRGAKVPNLFCEVNENMKAYGVASHRHTPEIEEQLGYAGNCQVTINFTPHLVPMNRGILATEYATLKRKPDGTLPTYEEVKAVYDKYYANEKFVRVLDKGSCPETKWVEGSNYVDINFVIDERTGRIIMMGALDNLVKGAAGQAVQNMNLLFGLPESEFVDMGEEDFVSELEEKHKKLAHEIDTLDVKLLLDGKYDGNNAIITIHSGAGGTEACDWVDMLYRMYSRWFSEKGYKVSQLDFMPGDSVGIKSITLLVEGVYAYGYLKAEKGVHRLVRISPFDANKKRHTSFASVDVLPEVDETVEVEINPGDLRIDTYRAGGAGGQHVNMTDSAVRITHIPTGIVTTCQQERSQLLNREKAMKVLQAKLLDLEIKKKEEEMKKLQGEQTDIGWGNQIRSYVFQPYTMVKDHRTGCESGNIRAVMDGDIDDFVNAYLRWIKR